MPSPPPITERLRAGWVAARRRYLLGRDVLGRIINALERGGVPVVPLKGPVLGELLYPDPELRSFTDLDVLVRRDDVPAALRILGADGFRQRGGEPRPASTLVGKGAVCLEPASDLDRLPLDVHWELVDPPGPRQRPRLATPEVWNRTTTVAALGRQVLALGPEDLLIYLAAHLGLHHPLSGLRWQLDLALLIRRFGAALDWGVVLDRARRWRLAGTLYFVLYGVRDRFSPGVPPSFLTALRPGGLRPALAGILQRRRDGQAGRFDYLMPLLAADRGADFVRALVAGVVPPADWVRDRYDGRPLLRAYTAHWARIGRIGATMVRGLVAG
jgi:hypothetical protein